MKRITLKELRLINFKGVSNFTLKPNEDFTTIGARNGKGKTTLFDALTYLLFGKDSQGNSQFSLKTLDENGNVIPKLPHEVSADILVDGELMSLRRVYEEKWVRNVASLQRTSRAIRRVFL